jgi:ubiquinone/menaquinone biosynthesis C-methylase UbiE
MPNASFEYHGLLARTWDLFRGDTSGWADRALYLTLIRRYGEPVLDVGCGTGRLLVDYRGLGIDIDGVDNSPEMLALCREKLAAAGLEAALTEQRMEALDLPRRYRTILVPSSSFQLLVERSAATAAMRRFSTHLEPGGALIMSFMVEWIEGEPLEREGPVTAKMAEDGTLYRRWTSSRFDPLEKLEHTRTSYEVSLGTEVLATEDHERSPSLRWYSQPEIVDLYKAADFSSVGFLHEFTEEAAGPEDRLFTAVGIR